MLLLPVFLDLVQVAFIAALVAIAHSAWLRTETYPTPREAPACLLGQEAAAAVSSALRLDMKSAFKSAEAQPATVTMVVLR